MTRKLFRQVVEVFVVTRNKTEPLLKVDYAQVDFDGGLAVTIQILTGETTLK